MLPVASLLMFLGFGSPHLQQAAAPTSPPATGQAERRLSGHVEDPSGGAIAGAAVTVICDGIVRTATTGSRGDFEVRDLPAAHCSVTGERRLFEPATVDVDLTTRVTGFARLVLSVAGLQAEVTVTASRGEAEQTFDVPEAVTVATREELESRLMQILPQALQQEPGVLVQQTTTAQGSPFIRGFSAQRIVYLLDGVRFNTSTFRAGATQYLGWINPGLVDRIEVVRGPASVQYGSDALGGTINVLASRPPLNPSGTAVSGSVEGVFGSADLSAALDGALLVQGPRVAFRVGGSGRAVDDLRTGRHRDSHSALTRFLGLPSDTRYTRLPDTGFRQAGGHVAVTAAAGPDATLLGVYLHEEQFGVSRYDRLLGGDGLHRSEFDPQRLDFGFVRYDRGRTGKLTALSTAFSVNRQQDDRLEQARPTERIEREEGHVTAFGYQAQGTVVVAGLHALTFGGEVYDEYIGAARTYEYPTPARTVAVRPEIPDGTRYTSSGLFVQDVADVLPGRLSLRGGVRHGYFSFRTQADPALGVEAERVTTDAITFSGGAVIHLSDSMNATLTVSRGFRAANAYDLGGIGISGLGFEISPSQAGQLGALIGTDDGSTALSTGVSVGALKPEAVYAFEAGLKFRRDWLNATFNVFDLEMVDIIQRRTAIFPTSVAGTIVAGQVIIRQDADGRAYIAGDDRPIKTRVNVDRARVLGLESEVSLRFGEGWIAGGYFSVANGHELGTGAYLRRMPPPFGGLRLKWEPPTWSIWIEGLVTVALEQTRLSAGDLSDARIGARRTRSSIASFFNGTATDLGLVQNGILVETGETLTQVQTRVLGGASAAAAPLYTSTPGFVTLAARAGWRVNGAVELMVLADNLTDRNYRWHGSGVDAPGFNVHVKARYRF